MRIATGKTANLNQTTGHSRAKRILHVVGSLGCGGIETWLLHVLRSVDRNELAMDFLVHLPEPAFYDEEVLDLGARIIFAGSHHTPIQSAKRIGRALSALGPYDVIHSHVGYYSGYTLTVARYHRIPIRIAHSHNVLVRAYQTSNPARRAYKYLMSRMVLQHATHGLAASAEAACDFFGPDWQQDPRFQVLLCGLDFSAFETTADRQRLRQQLGYTPENFVLTHVGSFTSQKNHDFLLDVLHALVQKLPQARLLLIGDGPLRPTLLQKVTDLGLLSHVHFAGLRTDIPQLLQAADAFAFTSFFEGLGLALIEAQAAALPCFISNTIPREAHVIPQLIHDLPLSAGPEHWSNVILQHHQHPTPNRPTPAEALAKIRQSPFDISYSIQQLRKVYTPTW